nr:hypothetical protein [Tanacetum cinerariifolium]
MTPAQRKEFMRTFVKNQKLQETTSVSAGATIAAVTSVSASFSVSADSSISAGVPIASDVSTTAGASGSAKEQDAPLRKSSRKKSIAKKRTLHSPSKPKSDAFPFDKDNPEAEFKRYLRQASDDDASAEPVSLALVSDITTWEIIPTEFGRSEIHVIIRADGTVKRFSTLKELMYWACRADLMVLYGLVSNKYKTKRATCIGLGLWMDLRTLITAREERELQETTSISAGATIAAVTSISAGFSVSAASSISAGVPITSDVSTTAGASGSAKEQDAPLRKSSRKKSIAKKRTLHSPSKPKSDAFPFDKDNPEVEFKRYLRQASDDDASAEPVSLALVSDITTWEIIPTEFGRSEIHVIIRADGTVKRVSTLRELMYWAGRADLMVLYGLVSNKYKTKRATCIGLGLWMDLRTLITAREERGPKDEADFKPPKASSISSSSSLQQHVLDLEKAKIAQAKEIAKLKKRVKNIEKRRTSRPIGLRRLKKVGSSKQVESSKKKDSLGAQEDASKQGRSIEDIDQDAEIPLVDEAQGRMHDVDMFGFDDLEGNEVFVDVREKIVEKEVSTADLVTTVGEVVTTASVDDSAAPTTATTTDVDDELTLAKTLIAIKAAKPNVISTAITRPRAKGIIFYEQVKAHKPTVSSSKDKGKGKMMELEKPLKNKDQIALDEEVAR